MREHQDEQSAGSRAIASAILGDGTLIEMIANPEDHKTALAISGFGRITIESSAIVPRFGKVVAFSAQNNLLVHRVVLFPSNPDQYSDPSVLVAEVRKFIHRYADFSDAFEELASYYVLLTWIYDSFQEVPYLRLRGDFGSGKSRCLLTIGSLCYKPMFASGASTVSPLFRIIDTFRGTLVIDEGDFRFSDERAEITKILNNGNAAGFPVLRSEPTPGKEFNPRAFVVFGPKIIATRRLFEDRALESRCITEVMSGLPPRPDIPLSLPDGFHDEAQRIRNKLLTFRFLNFHLSREPLKPDPEIESRIAQVYAPLLSVVTDPAVRERILALARGASAKIRAERSASVEAQLVGIIEELWDEAEPLAVKAITERFSDEFGLDYPRPITPRWIGAQLRSRLSLTPTKTNGNFVIGASDATRLRALFERYSTRHREQTSPPDQ